MPSMKSILLLAPLVLWLAQLLLRTLLGRAPRRADITVGLSLVTLLYFLAVVGTGVFWVAKQELPAFDWHYLPGYVLLALTLTHVVLHWRSIDAYLKRRAPERLVAEDRAQFVSWVRWTGYGGTGVLCVGLLFSLGMRQGSRTMTVVATDEAHRPTTEWGQGGQIPVRRVEVEGASLPLAQWYHQGSSYPASIGLPGLTIATRPEVYNTFTGATVSLPDQRPTDGPGVVAAYDAWRTGRPLPAQSPMDLDQLSTILFHTQGVTGTLTGRTRTIELRAAPSADAVYPVNVYVVAIDVRGLAQGLYYYNPKFSALVLLQADFNPDKVAVTSGGRGYFENAPAVVVLTATFARAAYKNDERAYRYVAIDTGHAAYNLALSAASLGWQSPMLGRFDDQALQVALGLEVTDEAPILVMPLTREARDIPEPLFKPADPTTGKRTYVELIHGGTALRLAGGQAPLARHPAGRLPAEPGDVPLPPPAAGQALFESIRARRSVRKYVPGPLTLEELSALCAASAGMSGTTTDPLLADTAPLNLYPIVRDVKGLAPGVYRYLPGPHALRLLRAGDLSRSCEAASMHQEFCGTANVLFVKTVTWKDLFLPDGDRGYRYANLRAGLVGEALYLQGTALRLGVCGVGAFQDRDVAALLGLELQEEAPLYLTAVGRR
ncbi:MAG: SagB/ThcOx family dehydrogenase [Deltaproteobacteria bacterium]|nr:SagB/ThcOx family dehydrogenase [Deltaproteobacteria bacterium]